MVTMSSIKLPCITLWSNNLEPEIFFLNFETTRVFYIQMLDYNYAPFINHHKHTITQIIVSQTIMKA